jgi:GT2 family glycosyltransferase
LLKPVTVSIVSHGHLALVRELLAQLDQHCPQVIEKVVLTINIPEHDALAERTYRFPIERIENASAKGFGANHNHAFKRCTSPWFLVLNPDIALQQDLLTPMVEAAELDTGVMAPRIYEPPKQHPEHHRSTLTPVEIVARKFSGYHPPTTPKWIPGLFMLFRREAFGQIDGFDERYFMYGEDFDICARIQLAHWKIKVIENLAATHDARRASHFNAKHLYWHISSLARLWSSSVFWRFYLVRP